MEAIIGVIFVLVVVGIIFLTIREKRKNIEYVKETSRVYGELKRINSQADFSYVGTKELYLNPQLKSKITLEKSNLNLLTRNEVAQNLEYYKRIVTRVDSNRLKWQKYVKAYDSILPFTTEEEFFKIVGNSQIEYKKYLLIEQDLYKKERLQRPVTEITVHCHATYTSPSGRNHYWRDEYISFYELRKIIEEIDEEIESNRFKVAQKNMKDEERKAKQKRLRELDKLEVSLQKKEMEIDKREQEFIEATKGHIYTNSETNILKECIEIEENLSLSQKLKLLRTKFENGEISYEEYQIKRKELM